MNKQDAIESDEYDFVIAHHGTVIRIVPKNSQAVEWIEENVQSEPWQWLGGALVIDHRYADAIVSEIDYAGFLIHVTA